MQQNYVFREEMNLYRIVLASLLPLCQAWRVEVEPFENIPMYSKQNITFKLEMENGMLYSIHHVIDRSLYICIKLKAFI